MHIPGNPPPESEATEQIPPSPANLRDGMVQEVESDEAENILEESSSDPLDDMERDSS